VSKARGNSKKESLGFANQEKLGREIGKSDQGC
jgi:hypothetical protein